MLSIASSVKTTFEFSENFIAEYRGNVYSFSCRFCNHFESHTLTSAYFNAVGKMELENELLGMWITAHEKTCPPVKIRVWVSFRVGGQFPSGAIVLESCKYANHPSTLLLSEVIHQNKMINSSVLNIYSQCSQHINSKNYSLSKNIIKES